MGPIWRVDARDPPYPGTDRDGAADRADHPDPAKEPFDDPGWLAVCYVQQHRGRFVSRNGNPMGRFDDSPASSSGVGDDHDGNRTQRERASTTAWGGASIFPGGFTLVVCELTHT